MMTPVYNCVPLNHDTPRKQGMLNHRLFNVGPQWQIFLKTRGPAQRLAFRPNERVVPYKYYQSFKSWDQLMYMY